MFANSYDIRKTTDANRLHLSAIYNFTVLIIIIFIRSSEIMFVNQLTIFLREILARCKSLS